MSLSADGSCVATPSEKDPETARESNLHDSGDNSITIPGNARFVLTHNYGTCLRARMGYDKENGKYKYFGAGLTNFWVLPEGYEYFRARVALDYKEDYPDKCTLTGDMSEYVSVLCDSHLARKPETQAQNVLEKAKKICDLKWTPAAKFNILHESGLTEEQLEKVTKYQENVEYNGLPYGSGWSFAHYIGWHVSPHTFINAANDP
jgi:hypothetical protein